MSSDEGYPNPWDPGWVDTSPSVSSEGGGATGASVQSTTPQPSSDPNEPWVELDPLRRVSLIEVWDLIEALRAGGVPVLGSKPRRSSLFSGKLIDVRLRVPERLAQQARLIAVEQLGVR